MVALFLTHHILFQFDATGSMRYIEYTDHSSSRPPSEQPDGKSIKTKTQVLTRLCFQLRQLESIIILSTEIVLAKRMRDANSRHVVHLVKSFHCIEIDPVLEITLQITSNTEGEATRSAYIFSHPLFPYLSCLEA